MGVGDVIKFQEKNKNFKEFTARDLADAMQIGFNTARSIIGRMKKDSSLNLKFRYLTPEEKKERFGCIVNSPLKIYWLEL